MWFLMHITTLYWVNLEWDNPLSLVSGIVRVIIV